MSPVLVQNDVGYSGLRHAKASGSLEVWPSSPEKSPDFLYSRGVQFCHWMQFTLNSIGNCLSLFLSILFEFIFAIIIVCSKPKMIWIHASRVIALMKHLQSFWNWAIFNFVRYAMSVFNFSIHAKTSVSAPEFGSNPNPTFSYMRNMLWNWAVFVYLLPKLLLQRLESLMVVTSHFIYYHKTNEYDVNSENGGLF